ncbi:hypothetical protein FHG87_019568 [Trinorchestia longiramus]|nr:hypothetical protein FHG87_019568 [Trinorchestia longiramus]
MVSADTRLQGVVGADTRLQGVVGADTRLQGVVPGCEGKAGMGVIVTENPKLLMEKLPQVLASLRHNLPTYALPLFLRTVQNIDTTGTFKLKKLELQKEGFKLPKLLKSNAEEEGHTLFFLDLKKSQYVPLTSQLLDDILDARVGL